jgi:hypothetical protein
MDCEGGEWFINPGELRGFRRIECEIHNFDKRHPFSIFESLLKDAGFYYEIQINKLNREVCFIHASREGVHTSGILQAQN